MRPPILRLGLALLLCSFAIYARSQKPITGKEPSWVTSQTYDLSESPMEQDAEDGYLNMVYEEQISVDPRAIYTRKVVKVLTEAGVQNVSQISVDYDPTYQQLIFHTIRIIRDNKAINQLNLSKIKTIQQEKELDQHLYNGALTAMLILEDLRKGDLVESSYTIKGSNPVFKGRFSRILNFSFSVPVVHLYYKVIAQRPHSLALKNRGTTIAPGIKDQNQETSYEWKLSGLQALHAQDNLPGWYNPYSRVILSEFKSWQEVNDWAMELFPPQKNLSPALQQKIKEIRQENPTPEQQVTAALRFVQDEVRYMGIEVGENSHRPANPNKIFAQRFGDCKDKSYLLCTILNALDIEAYPVLINTYYKQVLAEWLPTANIFDHATTQVKLNGRVYWFDPTLSYQRGPIDMISYPDYRYGLVIAPGTTELTKIDSKEPGKVKVKEEFDVADMSGDARFTVTTHYTGSFADDTRSYTRNSSRHEIMKSYQDFYSNYYKDIKADSIIYKEDDSTGAFITKEYYSIENLWELKDGVKKAFFSPYLISSRIKRPKDTKRKMPFAIPYPAKYEEEVIINVPSDWSMNEGKNYVENDAFHLRARYDYGFRKVMLTYEYETLQDHIPVEKTQEYLAALDSVNNHFSYSLSNDERKESLGLSSSGKSKSNVSFYVSLIVLCMACLLIWLLTRKK